MSDSPNNDERKRLRSQIAALEQLVEVYARTTMQQSARLQDALGEIRRLKDELERRVEERTADLTRTIEALQNEATRRQEAEQELRATVAQLQQTTRQLEAALRSQKEALQLRDEFFNAVAHELRTPVTSLKGYVSLLRRMPTVSPAIMQQALRNIERSADRVSRLASQAVELAELERETVVFRRQRFDLADLVREVVAAAQDEYPHHQFRLDIAPAPIVADQQRIGQVVRYLLDNAVKYQPLGGEIAVGVRTEGDRVMLTVHDAGPGIPLERQRFVFEPMYEPIPPGAPGYVGVVGLGLRLCKVIVERHNGTISLTSAPSQGSTFTVTLPRAPGEDSLAPAANRQKKRDG